MAYLKKLRDSVITFVENSTAAISNFIEAAKPWFEKLYEGVSIALASMYRYVQEDPALAVFTLLVFVFLALSRISNHPVLSMLFLMLAMTFGLMAQMEGSK